MVVICSWCGEVIREKPPLDDRRVSHGICPDCRDRFEDELVGSGEHAPVADNRGTFGPY